MPVLDIKFAETAQFERDDPKKSIVPPPAACARIFDDNTPNGNRTKLFAPVAPVELVSTKRCCLEVVPSQDSIIKESFAADLPS